MALEIYISRLLFKQQRVVVPDFGTFFCEVKTAYYKDFLGVVEPPKKILTFDATDKVDDGVLAKSIKEHKSVSAEEANSFLQSEVSVWLETLQRKKKLIVPSIGEFYVSESNRLVFEPSEDTNFLATSFGLGAYDYNKIKRKFNLLNKPADEGDGEKGDDYNNSGDYYGKRKSRVRISILISAAILAIGIIIGAKIGYPLYKELIHKKTLLAHINVQKKIEDTIQEATISVETTPPPVSLPIKNLKPKAGVNEYTPDSNPSEARGTNSKNRYQVMAGLFKTEEEALKKKKELEFLCYDPIKLPRNEDGLYPVLYGTYNTAAEAAQEMLRIKRTTNQNVWIHIEK